MGGGGADAFPLAKAFLDAMPSILGSSDATGTDHYRTEHARTRPRALIDQAAGQPVEVEVSVEDPIALLKRATAVVTMGGYNSLVEVLQWRKKALVVPRRAPSAEQQLRSRLFADRGLVRMLDPEAALACEARPMRCSHLLEDDAVPHGIECAAA